MVPDMRTDDMYKHPRDLPEHRVLNAKLKVIVFDLEKMESMGLLNQGNGSQEITGTERSIWRMVTVVFRDRVLQP